MKIFGLKLLTVERYEEIESDYQSLVHVADVTSERALKATRCCGMHSQKFLKW